MCVREIVCLYEEKINDSSLREMKITCTFISHVLRIAFRFKVYKAISYIFLIKKVSKCIKMCCINKYLTVNPLIFNKYCMCNLLYMIVTHYQNKTLYNEVFCLDLLKLSLIHRTHSKFNIAN